MNKWIISLKKKKLALANTHIFFSRTTEITDCLFLALANNQSTPTLFLKVEKRRRRTSILFSNRAWKKKKNQQQQLSK